MTRIQDILPIITAQAVRRGDVPLLLWGDEKSGFIADLIYAVNEQMLLAGIRIPPGKYFQWSDDYKPVYTTDACLYVLEGQYTVQLPDTGEVVVADAGEMILLRGPQWHFGHNFTDSEVRVLETIAPPPSLDPVPEACPTPVLGMNKKALHDFPFSRGEGETRLSVIGRKTASPALIGAENKVLFYILGCTDKVSVAVFDLIAGQRSETIRCSKDVTIYVESGRVHVRIASEGLWDELSAEDAFYIPAGTEWQIFNHDDTPASLHFALAGNIGTDLETL
ncbi:MAG: hypothetical protein CVT83_04165 [Alphaproteobacteria bacterium HGW-Alphaproteobacteria-5]|nr:MAG: hypothetical protein CVT83_04165 [Alphaproteobacteria bacterium HGW-Alphaproteobacteria-5]